MDGVTERVSGYLKDRGIPISAVAEKTGISYGALYPSLCKNPTRKLRGNELLAVCGFLDINPMQFYKPPNGADGKKGA